METVDVNIPDDLLPTKLTLCVVQLRSPFFLEADIIRGVQYPIIGWLQHAHAERAKRLETLLNCISSFTRHVHILVLPEYGVSNEMLEQVKVFSRNNKSVVIGTYYDARDRVARTFAAVPSKDTCEIHTGCKIRRSPYDADVLRELPEDEKRLLRLHWSTEGRHLSLLVLSCIDFFFWNELSLDLKNSNIVACPMCSKRTELFRLQGEIVARWEPPGTSRTLPRMCILCNGVDLVGTELGICGESQLVVAGRTGLPQIPAGVEGGFVVDYDPLTLTSSPPTLTGSDRLVVEGASLFRLNRTWSTEWTPPERVHPAVPPYHPNLPFVFELHRFYILKCVTEYASIAPSLKGSPVGCSGVYGYHDLVFFGVDESIDLFRLRLDSWLPSEVTRVLERREEESFRVIGILKYRGRLFAQCCEEAKKDRYLDAEMLDGFHEHDGQVTLKRLHEHYTKQDLSDDEIHELLQTGVLCPDLPVSDIVETDIALGKGETLVLVFFSGSERGLSPDRVFEEHVVHAQLAHDERVRTIEICEQTAHGAVHRLQAHYILHVVGHYRDLNEIILDKIHHGLAQHGVTCGTRVIPVADVLSRESCSWMAETPIRNKATMRHVCELIRACVDERDPFVIKRLPHDLLDLVIQIRRKTEEWLRYREVRGEERGSTKNSRKQLARCIYFMSLSLDKYEEPFSEEIIWNLWTYCGPFCREVFGVVEGFLARALREKAEQIGPTFEEELTNAWRQGAGQKAVKLNMDAMPLGTLMQSVVYWNKTQPEERCIKDKEFGRRISQLQHQSFDSFRDALAHGTESYNPTTRMKQHLDTKKDIKRLFHALHDGLSFIMEEVIKSGSVHGIGGHE